MLGWSLFLLKWCFLRNWVKLYKKKNAGSFQCTARKTTQRGATNISILIAPQSREKSIFLKVLHPLGTFFSAQNGKSKRDKERPWSSLWVPSGPSMPARPHDSHTMSPMSHTCPTTACSAGDSRHRRHFPKLESWAAMPGLGCHVRLASWQRADRGKPLTLTCFNLSQKSLQ